RLICPTGTPTLRHSGAMRSIEPGIHLAAEQGEQWIPGSRFARPGMTAVVWPDMPGIHTFAACGKQGVDGRGEPGRHVQLPCDQKSKPPACLTQTGGWGPSGFGGISPDG